MDFIERDASHYDAIYSRPYPAQRYANIYSQASEWCHGKVLDMGCGTGELRAHLASTVTYDGFDFSNIALKVGLRQGNLYTEPLEGYDTYVLLEVLEHVDDLKVLKRIPQGKTVILSVPSFLCDGHLRTYDEFTMHMRFADLLDIHEVHVFIKAHRTWLASPYRNPHDKYIFLARCTKR